MQHFSQIAPRICTLVLFIEQAMNGPDRSVRIPVSFLVRASIRTRVCRACSFFHVFCYRGPARANKLRIFLIKLSHSSSTYENTFAFQHFSERRRVIIFGLKKSEYSVTTMLGSSSSVKTTELTRSFLLLDYRAR